MPRRACTASALTAPSRRRSAPSWTPRTPLPASRRASTSGLRSRPTFAKAGSRCKPATCPPGPPPGPGRGTRWATSSSPRPAR
eukprot:9159369-Lingulodinium_polyedra.AAC.1